MKEVNKKILENLKKKSEEKSLSPNKSPRKSPRKSRGNIKKPTLSYVSMKINTLGMSTDILYKKEYLTKDSELDLNKVDIIDNFN